MSVAVLAVLGVIIGMLFYFYSGASGTITGRGSIYHYYYYSHPVINFEKSSNNVTIDPYHVKTISVSCGGDNNNNNNLQPLNGGYKSVNGITRGLYVISSFPDPVSHIWNVKIANVGSVPATVQAMTECIHDSNS